MPHSFDLDFFAHVIATSESRFRGIAERMRVSYELVDESLEAIARSKALLWRSREPWWPKVPRPDAA